MPEDDRTNLSSADVGAGTQLPGTRIELRRPTVAPRARAAFFDFDGTLSLIRGAWADVMVSMMVDVLGALDKGEAEADLARLARRLILPLTGRQTVYQMIELAKEVEKRGGTPLDPVEYKDMFLDRFWPLIKDRVQGLEQGRIAPEEMLVPGSVAFLEALRDRGLTLVLASGTDHETVIAEAGLLGIAPYFEGRMYGAIEDHTSYSKQMVMQRMVADCDGDSGALVGFSDGYADIEDLKAARAVAIGVAPAVPACREVDEANREFLIQAGADVIIPNYLEHETLLAHLFETPT